MLTFLNYSKYAQRDWVTIMWQEQVGQGSILQEQ